MLKIANPNARIYNYGYRNVYKTPTTSNMKLPATSVYAFQQLTDVRKSFISDIVAPGSLQKTKWSYDQIFEYGNWNLIIIIIIIIIINY